MEPNSFQHYQLSINGVSTHIVEAGDPTMPAILFLHGYPETWMAFDKVMIELHARYRVIAIELPGIGLSQKIESSDKKTIAAFIDELIQTMGLKTITLVGHDAGGMVAYAMLRYFPSSLSSVVVIGTAIPGLDPWEEVKRNPYIWHFAFYAIPKLPEILTADRLRPLFDYFYDTLSYNKDAISDRKRDCYVRAYEAPASLSTGFDWYRAFPRDEKDNAIHSSVDIPLLYIRGDKDYGKISDYVEGFKKKGINHLTAELIRDCGHFISEEQPDELARVIDQFIMSRHP